MTFYKITDWPHIAIIDPRTGENYQLFRKPNIQFKAKTW